MGMLCKSWASPGTCQRIICRCSLAYGYLISSSWVVSSCIKIGELLSQIFLTLPTQFENHKIESLFTARPGWLTGLPHLIKRRQTEGVGVGCFLKTKLTPLLSAVPTLNYPPQGISGTSARPKYPNRTWLLLTKYSTKFLSVKTRRQLTPRVEGTDTSTRCWTGYHCYSHCCQAPLSLSPQPVIILCALKCSHSETLACIRATGKAC